MGQVGLGNGIAGIEAKWAGTGREAGDAASSEGELSWSRGGIVMVGSENVLGHLVLLVEQIDEG